MSDTLILNYGDSQGEVFDYVFYNNSNYPRFSNESNIGWRSGWSVRGLNKIEHQDKLFNNLYNLSSEIKNVFIFLTFGSVDIEWNLSYKRYIQNINPDLDVFINEMYLSFTNIIKKYIEIEKELNMKKDINLFLIVCFPFIPLPLSDNYMNDFSIKNNTEYYQVISHKERCNLWNIYCNKICNFINENYYNKIKILDIRSEFLKYGFQPFLRNDIEDHHPDFIKTQKYIISNLKNIKFYDKNNNLIKLKPRPYLLDKMYKHIRRPLTN